MQSSNFKYTRRSGTSDLGKEYEVKILALLSLRCLLNQHDDFWLLFNAEGVGDFDDVILNCGGNTFLFQLKHQAQPKTIKQGEFLNSKQNDFSLEKYIPYVYNLKTVLNSLDKNKMVKDFPECLEEFNKVHFVLYTNRDASVEGTCDFLIKDCCKKQEFLSILNTRSSSEIFRFDSAKLEKQLKLKNIPLDYINNFYLFPSQIHVNELDKEIKQELEKITKIRDPKIVTEKFIKYISEWCKGDLAGDHSLGKHDITSKLTEIVCSQYSIEKLFQEPYCFYTSEKKLLWNNVIKDKSLIIIDPGSEEDLIIQFLCEFIGSEVKYYSEVMENKNWASSISKKNKTAFYQKDENFRFQMLKLIGDSDKISLINIYNCLWYLNKLPILLRVTNREQHKHITNVLKLSNYFHKVIVINKTNGNLPLMDKMSSRLENLIDLNKQDQEIILQQEIKLQGRPGAKLENVIDKSMFKDVKTVDIINILLDQYNIGEELNFVPKFYMNRRLSKILIKFEALERLTNQLFLIDDYKNYFNVVSAEEDLPFAILGEINLENLRDYRIIVNTKENSPEVDSVFCSGESVHHLHFCDDGHLEWKRSSKNLNSIRKYIIMDYEYKCDEYDIQRSSNLLTIVSAPPGMGKSMLMTHMAQEATLNKWILRIDLNSENNQEYYEDYNCKSEHTNSLDHFNHFRESSNFELHNKVFQKFLNSKRIIVILDGFDEISTVYKEEVRNIAKSFINDDFCTWITTRPIMKSYLEEQFNCFALGLSPFTPDIQKKFLKRYLARDTEEYSSGYEEFLDKFIEKLLESFKKNIIDQDVEFTSTPLHIALLAEYFSDQCEMKSEGEVEFNEQFDLLDLYDKFIKRKIKILCEKFGSGSRTWRASYREYQYVCSLKLLFPRYKRIIDEGLKDLKKLSNINIELMQKEGVLAVDDRLDVGFTHRTFAEYLAAEWLFINFKNRNEDIKDIVKVLVMQRFSAQPIERKEHKFLFNIFDRLLSRPLNLHLDIINGKGLQQTELLSKLDKASRSVVHLTALYIQYHPSLLDIFPSIVDKFSEDDNSLVVQTDELGYNPLDYALMNDSVELASLICKKWKNSVININLDLRIQRTYINRASSPKHAFLLDTVLAYFVFRNVLSGNIDIQETMSSYAVKSLPSALADKYEDIHVHQLPKFEIYKNNNELNYEIIFGSEETIEELLEVTEHINMRDADGKTALHYAILNNKLELIDLLLSSGANVNIRKLAIVCPLYFVPHPMYHTNIINPDGDDDGNTPLHYAVLHKNLNLVNMLASKGADVNIKNCRGKTALHYAVRDDIEIVDKLLVPGTNINNLDDSGNTALHISILYKKPTIVSLLLTNRANVNIQNFLGDTPLHICAFRGQHDIAAKLLTHNNNLNMRNKRRDTPLHIAIVERKIETILFLLEHGADVNIENSKGDTPLHLGASYLAVNIFSKLLSCKTDINRQNKVGDTALHLASRKGNLEIIDLLISHGADINSKNSVNGDTPLYYSIETDDFKAIQLLINNKADLNIPNVNTGNTPLLYALMHRKFQIIDLLLTNNADVNLRNLNETTPFHIGSGYCNIETVEKLMSDKIEINVQNILGNTPLHYASRQGNLQVAKWLIKNEADVNLKNYCKKTVSSYLIEEYDHIELAETLMHPRPYLSATVALTVNTPLHDAALHKQFDIIDLLLASNADTNIKNSEDSTPLHYAVSFCNGETVEKLILHKADIHVLNRLEGTPLHRAVLYRRLDIIELLLSKGANVNAENEIGKTPFHYSVTSLSKEFVEKLIVSHKADVNASSHYGSTPLHLAIADKCFENVNLLLLNGSNVNAKDEAGDTPLQIAAYCTNVKMAELLLLHNADINVFNKKRNTPLHEALCCGKSDIAIFLVSKGAKVNIANLEKDTPLHYGAKYCNVKVVEKLISYKAKPNVLNKEGNTPLHFSAMSKKLDIMELLLSNGADKNIKNKDGKTPHQYIHKRT